ncbi:MAG: hypothetical protein L6Q98_16805 [Anaerolineae bacterium]|nr:hypothetical protein [Anaerolineae bacterium]NUQ03901.1 hypothetical protein [Anaerolineae bacterium]
MTEQSPKIQAVNKTLYLSQLPPEWSNHLLIDQIRKSNEDNDLHYVVIDDDAAGSQTVKDVHVLTSWSGSTLESALNNFGNFFVLTNSRSLTSSSAFQANSEIATKLAQLVIETNKRIIVISRTDSTLRGHFFVEIQAITQAFHRYGINFDGICFIPFFYEGRRYTCDNIQWVEEKTQLIPAAATPYANDAVFSYKNSYLPLWIEEQTQGKVNASEVFSIDIHTIREGGPDAIAKIMAAITGERYVLVNALTYRDLEVFIRGWQIAESEGKRFLFRTAASFLKTAMGIGNNYIVPPQLLANSTSKYGGITVFGSHVPKSTGQLEAVRKLSYVKSKEINVDAILSAETRDDEIIKSCQFIHEALEDGYEALIFTSRTIVKADSYEKNLAIGQAISIALAEIVDMVQLKPKYVIAKGGVTASNIAILSLKVDIARVVGQAADGIPVWKLGEGSKWANIPFVIFPGNVGELNTLADIISKFRLA